MILSALPYMLLSGAWEAPLNEKYQFRATVPIWHRKLWYSQNCSADQRARLLGMLIDAMVGDSMAIAYGDAHTSISGPQPVLILYSL